MDTSGPTDVSNRWPWIALGAGVLVIVAAAVIFFLNRSNAANVAATPSPLPAAVSPAASPASPAASPASPAAVASPSPAPTDTPTSMPSPTSTPSIEPTPEPSPSPSPAVPPASPPASPAVASPSPFVGQVSAAGGLGNTRQDIDAAYGSPVGQTPQNLVVFRANNSEYHIELMPDLNGRAALIAVIPPQTAQALTLEQAQAQAHALLPHDAQPPSPTPEGNNQFVTERYTSQSLGEALPTLASGAVGQPLPVLIVYEKDRAGNIARWVVGTGNDPSVLLSQAG